MKLDDLYELLRTRHDLQLEIGRLEEQKATQSRQIEELDRKLTLLYKQIEGIESKVSK
jgi:uncharacterized coiled-coil protein SlyX